MARDRKGGSRWLPGSPVAGTPFRALRLLGAGGMSAVYAVEHETSGARYALKVLSGRLTHRPDCVARFELEAQALENLGHHPNLVSLHDAGRLPDGRPFLVMRLLEGETLRQALRRGPLPVPYACSFVQQLLSALWAVHGAGVVHRDVKPDNLFVSPDGRCTLLDFGVIKVQAGASLLTSAIVTEPGSIIGTAHYIAPEQAQCRATDARADLYAAGVVLAECLTGRVPLGDRSPDQYMRHIAERGFPSLDEVGALHVPPELRRVVRKATMQDPNERYASAEAFSSALSWVALELGINVPGVQSGPWRTPTGQAPPARSPAAAPSTTLDANPPPDEAPSANATRRKGLAAAPAEAARSEAKTLASASAKPPLRRLAPRAFWLRAPAPGGRFGRRSPRAASESQSQPDAASAAPPGASEPGLVDAPPPGASEPGLVDAARPGASEPRLVDAPPLPPPGPAPERQAFAAQKPLFEPPHKSSPTPPRGTERPFSDVTAPRAVTVLWQDDPNDPGPPASLERDGVSSPKPKMGPPASDSATRISRMAAWGTLLFAMAIFATPRWRPRLVDSLVTITSPSLPEGWDTTATATGAGPRPREAYPSAPGPRRGPAPGHADANGGEPAPPASEATSPDAAEGPAAAAPSPAPAKPSLRADEGRPPNGSSAAGRSGSSRPHPFRAGLKPNY